MRGRSLERPACSRSAATTGPGWTPAHGQPLPAGNLCAWADPSRKFEAYAALRIERLAVVATILQGGNHQTADQTRTKRRCCQKITNATENAVLRASSGP